MLNQSTAGQPIAVQFDDERFRTDRRPWIGELPTQPSGDFAFAVVGDRCGMAAEGVFEKALELLRDLRPDFVLSVGDLIEGYWKQSDQASAEWDEVDAAIEASGLTLFHTVGNHDYGNDVMRDVWRERKGFEYYGFRFGDALFIVLNSEDPPTELSDDFIGVIKTATDNFKREPERAEEHLQAFYRDIVRLLPPEQLSSLSRIDLAMGDEQLEFARRMLDRHRDAAHVFVSLHKPGWKSDSAQYLRLTDMLKDRPHTIFAGHLHAMEYVREGGQERIQLGRTGGLAHGSGPESDHLVLWVNVRGGVPSYRVIPLDAVRDAAAYPPLKHSREQQSSEPVEQIVLEEASPS